MESAHNIMSTLTESESTLSMLAILNPSRSKWGMTLESGSLFPSTKFITVPNVYSTGTLYFGRLWSSFLKDKTKMLIANKVPAKHHWSPEACLQLCQGFHNTLLCISFFRRVESKMSGKPVSHWWAPCGGRHIWLAITPCPSGKFLV